MYYLYEKNSICRVILPEPLVANTYYKRVWIASEPKSEWVQIGWWARTSYSVSDYKLVKTLTKEELFLEIL